MDLFIVRNLLSIQTAETIIQVEGIKSPVAMFASNDPAYRQKLKAQLCSNEWQFVPQDDYLYPLFALSYAKDIRNYRNYVQTLFRQMKISRIFLSCLNSDDEKILYGVAQANNIKVYFYEEGTNLYCDLYGNDAKARLKGLLKALMTRSLFELTFTKGDFRGEKLYCLLPEKYKFDNVTEIIKLTPNFASYDKATIENLDIRNLFLSRPLSEDGLVTLDEEISILRGFFGSDRFDDVIVKFHPRESAEKIDRLKEEFKFSTLPAPYENLSAEQIVWNGNVENLIGYETSTLAYVSELKPETNVFSLLQRLVATSNSSHLNTFYDLYREDFRKINFL